MFSWCHKQKKSKLHQILVLQNFGPPFSLATPKFGVILIFIGVSIHQETRISCYGQFCSNSYGVQSCLWKFCLTAIILYLKLNQRNSYTRLTQKRLIIILFKCAVSRRINWTPSSDYSLYTQIFIENICGVYKVFVKKTFGKFFKTIRSAKKYFPFWKHYIKNCE